MPPFGRALPRRRPPADPAGRRRRRSRCTRSRAGAAHAEAARRHCRRVPRGLRRSGRDRAADRHRRDPAPARRGERPERAAAGERPWAPRAHRKHRRARRPAGAACRHRRLHRGRPALPHARHRRSRGHPSRGATVADTRAGAVPGELRRLPRHERRRRWSGCGPPRDPALEIQRPRLHARRDATRCVQRHHAGAAEERHASVGRCALAAAGVGSRELPLVVRQDSRGGGRRSSALCRTLRRLPRRQRRSREFAGDPAGPPGTQPGSAGRRCRPLR